MNAVERVNAQRERERLVPRRACADPDRRARLERSAPDWLKHYFPGMFPAPWSESHLAIISNIEQSVLDGTGSAVAAPRGDGKSQVTGGMTWYLLARRLVRFPVIVNWKIQDGRRTMAAWLRMLSESAEFAADYPEITQPFELSTHSARLKTLRWSDTGKHLGALVDASDKLITLPDSIGAVAIRSANGDAKGLAAHLIDGTVLRPDFIIFDDAQDVNAADKPSQVADTIDRLENVFLGMAGPQTRIKAACACTVEHEGDVSCHWLNRPGWRSVRVPRIKAWPGGEPGGDWPAKRGDPQRELWDEWWGIHNATGPDAAREFYRANAEAMSAGMVVSWEHRFDKAHDVCAFDAAMYEYYDKGADVFARAQQNAPIKRGVTLYTLTPAVIMSRVADRAAGEVPAWSCIKIAATDVNPSYGLTWGVTAFGRDQTAGVMAYGVHEMSVPKEATAAEADKMIFENLVAHGRKLAALSCRPDAWFVDAGGAAFDVVHRFCEMSVRLCGLQATPCTGRGSRNYRPFGKSVLGQPREQCHEAIDTKRRRWIVFNADYWREIAQKAWTGSVGAPGSCSLPAGNHRHWAEQICREQLQGKGEVGDAMVWVWNTQPGPHDGGDVMTMCFMGAAWRGVGTGGAAPRKVRRVETRKCKVQREL